jgi:hypothetical protein
MIAEMQQIQRKTATVCELQSTTDGPHSIVGSVPLFFLFILIKIKQRWRQRARCARGADRLGRQQLRRNRNQRFADAPGAERFGHRHGEIFSDQPKAGCRLSAFGFRLR